MASMAPVPGFCPERKRLTTEFTMAVSDYNHLQSKQLRSLTLGLGFEYESVASLSPSRLIANLKKARAAKTTAGGAVPFSTDGWRRVFGRLAS